MSSNTFIEIIYYGECLCDLALKYNTTVARICELNMITNVSYIRRGEKLLIEVGKNGIQNKI